MLVVFQHSFLLGSLVLQLKFRMFWDLDLLGRSKDSLSGLRACIVRLLSFYLLVMLGLFVCMGRILSVVVLWNLF